MQLFFPAALIGFTFQYVSINTKLAGQILAVGVYLHSNMFLLILIGVMDVYDAESNLHSNMFLLIHIESGRNTLTEQNLHSNMFLLIRGRNSHEGSKDFHLHSNMFLLIPDGIDEELPFY